MIDTSGMQAFDATEECQKVKERFAFKRQLREQQRLGMPLPRGVRWVLHSSERATARPNTCPPSVACNHFAVAMPGEPLHTGTWIHEEIGAFVPVSDMRNTAHRYLQPGGKQIEGKRMEGMKNVGVHHDHPVPQVFRPAAIASEAGPRGVPDALSCRTTSPLVSGVSRPVSVNAAAAMASLNHRLPTKSRDRCRGGEDVRGTAADTEAPCHPMLYCDQQMLDTATTYVNDHADEGMRGISAPYIAPSVVSTKASSVHKLGENFNAAPVVDDQVLGHLDEESRRLAEMSQGLLKRAAELLGQSEEFEHAVELTSKLRLGSTVQHPNHITAAPFPHGTHTTDYELTPDEKGLLQDLIAAV